MASRHDPVPAAVADTGFPIPIGMVLDHHARHTPSRVCLTVGEEARTHSELDIAANRRARMLSEKGVAVGDFVTVALPNSIEFYETTFALWKLGAIPHIVSPRLPDAELGAIVDLVDPKLVIGLEPTRAAGRATIAAGSNPPLDFSGEALPAAVAPHWKAMTSGGSTGRPKIVVDALPSVWNPRTLILGRRADDTQLNAGPLYHAAPFSTSHQGLFGGLHIVDMQKFDAERMLALIEQHHVNWIQLVPTMMHRIMRLPRATRLRYDISSMRAVFHMGAPCPVWLKQAWIDWLGPDRILEVYGGTERVGNTAITGKEWLDHRGSVGRPQAGAQVRILRDDGEIAAAGEIGEIYFLPAAGRGSGYHYIGAQAKSAGDWETLGDLGYLDGDGYLYVVDRRTDLIVSGGANVYPAEVEAALEAHPAVACAVVVGLPDADLGSRVHAIVQLSDPLASDSDALDRHVRKLVAAYKAPRSIEIVAEPLRDESGKVRRSQVRDLCIARGKQGGGH